MKNIKKTTLSLALLCTVVLLGTKNTYALITAQDKAKIRAALCVAKTTYAGNEEVQCAVALGDQALGDVERESTLLDKLAKAIPEIKKRSGGINPDKVSTKEGVAMYKLYQELCAKYHISDNDIERVPQLLDRTVDKLRRVEGHLTQAIADISTSGSWFGSCTTQPLEYCKRQLHPKLQELKGYQALINQLKARQAEFEKKFSFLLPKKATAQKAVNSKAPSKKAAKKKAAPAKKQPKKKVAKKKVATKRKRRRPRTRKVRRKKIRVRKVKSSKKK